MNRKLKIKTVVILSMAFLALGCTRSYKTLGDTAQSGIEQSEHYQKTKVKSDAQKMSEKYVKANFANASIYYAVSQVSKSLGIPLDNDFIPLSDYKVTMNFKGTFGAFLREIYKDSGIDYKYRNGILSVFNKNEVDRAYKVRKCRRGEKKISIALDGVPPSDIFKYMSESFHLNFTFNTKYYDLKGGESSKKESLPSTSLYYKGCDKFEALRMFIRANDLRMEIRGKKNIEVFDYKTAEIDLPVYWNVNFTGGGSSVGSGGSSSGGSSSQSQGSSSGSAGTEVTSQENFRDEFKTYIESRLTRGTGKAYVSHRGYITIVDKPSIVREVKKLLRIEKMRQQPIKLSVSIIKMTLNDDLAVGVDWNQVLAEIANRYGYSIVTANLNLADRVGDGVSLSGTKNGLTNMVKGLQEYGEARIDRSFVQEARSGILSSFSAVDEIPYTTSRVVTTAAGSQIANEAKIAQSGLILNITPTYSDRAEYVNLSTNIEVSEYQGDKTLPLPGGGEYILPQIGRTTLSIPARIKMGDTIVLTGLKINEGANKKEGIPGLSQAPTVLGGLFGHNSQSKKVTEALVVITVSPVGNY